MMRFFVPGGLNVVCAPQRGGARRAELRVHPGYDPARRVVRRVGDVHAPRASEHDGARPRRLHHHLHHQGRLAALTGAVPRGEVLLDGQLLHALERVEVLGGAKLDQIRELLLIDGHGLSSYSRRPIHCVEGCGFPAAAAYTFSVIFFTSGSVTSRPPRPQMNAISGGRFGTGYSAARTSVASTPLE